MTFDEFISVTLGQKIDVDGTPEDDPVQCVDYAKYGLKKIYGIAYFPWGGSARNLFENFDKYSSKLKGWKKIKNTPEFVPQKGDLCFWGKGVGGGNGHVAWASGEGNTKQFYSYDENWKGKAAHKQLHTYSNFIGVLRYVGNTTTASANKKYKITVNNLNIRKGPGTTYERTGEYAKPGTYSSSKQQNNFAYLDALKGWVSMKYVTETN